MARRVKCAPGQKSLSAVEEERTTPRRQPTDVILRQDFTMGEDGTPLLRGRRQQYLLLLLCYRAGQGSLLILGERCEPVQGGLCGVGEIS